MRYLWRLEKAYLKNILDEFSEPRPATTTIATLLKRVIDKGFVGFHQHAAPEYFPIVKKTEYFSSRWTQWSRIIYNSAAQLLLSSPMKRPKPYGSGRNQEACWSENKTQKNQGWGNFIHQICDMPLLCCMDSTAFSWQSKSAVIHRCSDFFSVLSVIIPL